MKNITKESIKKEKKRREIKEGAYTNYAKLGGHLLKNSYYKDFDTTLSTFLALNMVAEATKSTLMKMGGTAAEIESARAAIKKEMWTLMGLKEKGVIDELLRRHFFEQEQAEKK